MMNVAAGSLESLRRVSKLIPTLIRSVAARSNDPFGGAGKRLRRARPSFSARGVALSRTHMSRGCTAR